jgi:hypothetical protein
MEAVASRSRLLLVACVRLWVLASFAFVSRPSSSFGQVSSFVGGCSSCVAPRRLCPFVGAGVVGVRFEAVVVVWVGGFVCGRLFVPRRRPTFSFRRCPCLNEVGWEEGGAGMLTNVQKRRMTNFRRRPSFGCHVAVAMWHLDPTLEM